MWQQGPLVRYLGLAWSTLAWGCLLSTFAISPHLAADLFVDDDDPVCAIHYPCFSRIQAAVDASHPGDTVRVRPGTYYERVLIQDKELSLLSEEGPDVTIIDGGGILTSTVTVSGYFGDVQARIRGFTIQNGGKETNFNLNGYGIAISGFGDIKVQVENNVIRDNPVNGGVFVYSEYASKSEVIIDGNRIERNGYEGGISVYFGNGSDTVRIRNNIVAFNIASGIYLYPGSLDEVVNNTVYGNGVTYQAAGVVAPNMPTVRVTNNILYGNTSRGSRDLSLYFVGVGVPPASPSFNIIGDGQFNGVNGNVAQDPLLVAPQAGDFHLKPQSPAIDTGDNNSAQGTYDFEGDPRISDGNDDGTVVVDRGADEHSTNDPPVADAGEDGQVECAGPDGAFVVLDGSRSSDPDSTAGTNDDIVRFEWYEDYGTPSQRLLGAGETLQVGLSLGSHSVTLKVTDRVGKSDTAGTTVAVVDTTPPVMECPAVPGAMECTGLGGAWVDLFAYAYDTCGEVMTLINDRTEFGPDAADIYPVGSTAVGFTATDQNGVQATCSTTVNVVDTIPPELALLAEPATLWPPDRRLVSVAVRWVTRDACDPDAVSVELDSATSDEPDTGRLMGNDIQGAEIGTADGALGLRAERNGQGAGRVYTLTYRAIDGAGNVTLREATVSVPHDQQPSPSEILPRTPARRMRGGRASMPPPVPTVPH